MIRILEWCLLLVVIGSVLAFGAVEPLAYSLMEIAMIGSLSWLVITQTRQGVLTLSSVEQLVK